MNIFDMLKAHDCCCCSAAGILAVPGEVFNPRIPNLRLCNQHWASWRRTVYQGIPLEERKYILRTLRGLIKSLKSLKKRREAFAVFLDVLEGLSGPKKERMLAIDSFFNRAFKDVLHKSLVVKHN